MWVMSWSMSNTFFLSGGGMMTLPMAVYSEHQLQVSFPPIGIDKHASAHFVLEYLPPQQKQHSQSGSDSPDLVLTTFTSSTLSSTNELMTATGVWSTWTPFSATSDIWASSNAWPSLILTQQADIAALYHSKAHRPANPLTSLSFLWAAIEHVMMKEVVGARFVSEPWRGY